MNKLNRIKSFVKLDNIGEVIKSKNHTKLYDKLVQNVKCEYQNYHKNQIAATNKKLILSNDSKMRLDFNCEKFQVYLTNLKAQNPSLPFAIMQEESSDSTIKTLHFVSESKSHEHFYQLQRQHKIWWREIGTSPAMYSVSDQQIHDGVTQVTFRSSVVDPSIELENLCLISTKEKPESRKFSFKVPERNIEIVPDIIESSFNLHQSSLAILLDADQLSSSFLALHRRISPYQFAIVRENTSNRDLIDLARLIELLIRETDSSIEVLNVGEKQSESCDNLDQIGIPYDIVLEESALEHGILKLRNRNTTLSESIHLSDIPSYLIKIIKS